MPKPCRGESRYILSGGGGGGTSLYDLPLEEIDLTDGSWTLFDPDGLIDTVTFGSNFNTVTWNALAVASVDYNWSGGTNIRAPRWYKSLTIDGNSITNEDLLLVTTRMELDAASTDFNQQVVAGVALVPNSTVLLTLDGSGGQINRVGGGARAYGTWQANASTTGPGGGLNVFGVTTVQRGFNAVGSGVYLNMGSGATPDVTSSGSRNSNQNNASAGLVNVSVIVGVGPRANTDTIAAGNQQRFKASIFAATLGGLV